MSDKQYHEASDPENRNDVLDAEMLRDKLKRATDAQPEDAKTCRAWPKMENTTLDVECSMSDEAFKELFKDKLSKLTVLSVCRCPRCLLERRIDQPPSFKHKEIAFKDRIIGFCPKCGWEALYGGETAHEAADGWNHSVKEFSEMLYEKLTKEAQEKNK